MASLLERNKALSPEDRTGKREIILASGSRYRGELLRKLQLPFSQQASQADETPIAGEHPYDLVRRLARLKADALATEHPGALLIASDQVAAIDGQLLGKPGETGRAEAQLALLSGRTALFYTSLLLLDASNNQGQIAVERTEVQFRTLTTEEIRRYVALEQPLDCAGAFKAEGLGITLFHAIRGDDPNALIGLPLIRLSEFLRNVGVQAP